MEEVRKAPSQWLDGLEGGKEESARKAPSQWLDEQDEGNRN